MKSTAKAREVCVTKLLVELSVFFSALAYVPYIMAIIKTRKKVGKGRISPNRASWFVWSLIDISMVISLTAAHSYSVVPMFVAYSFGSTFTFLLSIKYGEGGFNRFDLGCVAVGAMGLVLWKVLGTPVASITANLVAASAGALPTLKKGWGDPESENPLAYVLFAMGGFCNCLTIKEFTFVAAATPIVVLGLQIALVFVVLRPQIMSAVGMQPVRAE